MGVLNNFIVVFSDALNNVNDCHTSNLCCELFDV